jgi:hypothetical protein
LKKWRESWRFSRIFIFLSQGATLYDLLGREVDLREKRQAVLAKNLEIQVLLSH